MSRLTNPGRHPPSPSSETTTTSQSPTSTQRQQQQQLTSTPVYSTQQPFPTFDRSAFQMADAIPQIQTYVNPMQDTSSPTQQLPLQHQPTPTPLPTSSPTSRNSSARPRPRSIENKPQFQKAVRLYNVYYMARMLEDRQQTPIYQGGQLNVPAPGSSRSAPSGTTSRLYPPSQSNSVYGGTTDPSSVIDFADDEGRTSPNERGHEGRSVYNGRPIRQRIRKQFTPAGRAKTALIRHLKACENCHRRNVNCSLEHHDIAALERERLRLERDQMTPSTRRPHSQSTPQQTPNPPAFSHASSHDAMRSASTGQISEHVGMTNDLSGLGTNDHFLHTVSPISTGDPHSPSQFQDPDFLAGIQARDTEQLPFNVGQQDSYGLGVPINFPASMYSDGSLLPLGVQQQQQGGFACYFCPQILDDPEVLQVHVELRHRPFTRIDPAHRYFCGLCGTQSNIPMNRCYACNSVGSCETRIFGRYISSLNDRVFPTDDQSPYTTFSPNSDTFSGSQFDFSTYQNLGPDNGMGPSGGRNMQGGDFNFGSNYHFQPPTTQGGSHGSPNSPRNSQAGDLFPGNQYSANGAVERNFDYFHAKGRQKLHRHRLLVAALIVFSITIFQIYTWVVAKAEMVMKTPSVGFASMVASFVMSYAYWTIRDALSEKSEASAPSPLPSISLGCKHTSSGRFFHTTISIC